MSLIYPVDNYRIGKQKLIIIIINEIIGICHNKSSIKQGYLLEQSYYFNKTCVVWLNLPPPHPIKLGLQFTQFTEQTAQSHPQNILCDHSIGQAHEQDVVGAGKDDQKQMMSETRKRK